MNFIKLSVALLFTLTTFGKLVVVSDIDDTIKVSHVRDTIDLVRNAYKTKNIFLGMSTLYHGLKQESDAKIYYLTNAPKLIMEKSHKKLLRNGKFPKGTLLARSGYSSDEFKTVALEAIMEKENPTEVILLGDNGELDIYFYDEIAKKYPTVKFTTFIRIAYNKDDRHSPINGQYGFVSPFEILSVLNSDGKLSNNFANDFYAMHAPKFLVESRNNEVGRMYIPKWLTCKGHDASLTLDLLSNDLQNRILKKVNKICTK